MYVSVCVCVCACVCVHTCVCVCGVHGECVGMHVSVRELGGGGLEWDW